MSDNLARFRKLDFEGFRKLAGDDSLSMYEKIGFPNGYREGKEDLIFADIRRKLTNLDRRDQTIIDIGPGCSELPLMLVNLCREQGHKLILIDSPEMLARIPDAEFVEKRTGRFPHDCAGVIQELGGRVDVILTYSVVHYIFAEANVFDFLDRSLELLAPGGEMLIGDIPNISKRKRFFSSDTGVAFHQKFMNTSERPEVAFNRPEAGEIDDAVILALISRARTAGFDSYVLPQDAGLPMANRREDILLKRP